MRHREPHLEYCLKPKNEILGDSPGAPSKKSAFDLGGGLPAA